MACSVMTTEPEKPKGITLLQGLLAVLGVVGVAYYFTIGQDRAVASSMADIENKVAVDAVAQYEIAKRQGDAMQTCVQAGMVSAAYLQAKNEAQYTSWKATEKADCARAGLPSP
jgi:hypothetical protein